MACTSVCLSQIGLRQFGETRTERNAILDQLVLASNSTSFMKAALNQSKSFDVAVLGGGPAGLAMALTLHRYSLLSVVVIEKTNYDAPRIGETLSPGVTGLLQYLGVWESFQEDRHLPSFGTSATWGSPTPSTRDFILTPFGPGWHLNRRCFDESL